MLDLAGLDATLRQLPQFLEAQAVGLRLLAGVEAVAPDQFLGDAAAAAFGEDGGLRADLGAGREVLAGRAVLVEAHVADLHAGDGAVVVEERLGRREAREHVDASRLCLRAEHRDDVAERDDEVAVIVHLRRRRQLVALRTASGS